MNKALKAAVVVLLIIFGCLGGFYYWGGSGQISQEEYSYVRELTAAKPAEVDTSGVITLMTYNIGYLSGMTNNRPVERTAGFFDSQMNEAKQLLSLLDVDIIGYQEIDFGSKRSFNVDQLDQLSNPKYPYSALAVNWDKNYVPFPYWPPSAHFGRVLSGQAVSSRFVITSSDRIVLPKPSGNSLAYNRFYIDRIVQVVTIIISGKEVKVLNVHLEAFDKTARLEQAKILTRVYKDLAASYPVILMGDFNSVPPFASDYGSVDNAMYVFFNESDLTPVISQRQYLADEPAAFTYSSDNPRVTLDHIFVSSKDFEVVDARVVHEAETISDHLPVIAKIKMRQ